MQLVCNCQSVSDTHTHMHGGGGGNTHSCLAHQRKVQLVEVARINMPQTEPSTQRS